MAAAQTSAITKFTDLVRFWVNEPTINAKWTDARIIETLQKLAPVVTQSIYSVAENPTTVNFTITTAANVLYYMLPPYVGEVLRIGRFDSDTGQPLWFGTPRSRWNPMGPGISFVGQNIVYIQPDTIPADQDITFEFVPNGEVVMHAGDITLADIDTDTSGSHTVRVSLSPTVGAFDKRPNAFIGAILRLYDGPNPTGMPYFPVCERLITQQSNNVVTVVPDLPTDMTAGSYSYEIVPIYGGQWLYMLMLRTAMFMLGMENPERLKPIRDEFYSARRACLLSWSQFQRMVNRYMAKDTNTNPLYDNWYGSGM